MNAKLFELESEQSCFNSIILKDSFQQSNEDTVVKTLSYGDGDCRWYVVAVVVLGEKKKLMSYR
jgi:hypothetical protein